MPLRISERWMSAAPLLTLAFSEKAFASVATVTNVRNRRSIVQYRLLQQNIFAGDDVSSNQTNGGSSSDVGRVIFPVLIVLFVVVATWIIWYVRNQHQNETELSRLKTHASSRKQSMDSKDKSSSSDDTLSNSSGVDESFDIEMTRNVVEASDESIIRNSSEVQRPLTDHESQLSRRFSYLLDSLDSFRGIDCDDELYTEVQHHTAMAVGPVGVDDDDAEVTTDSFDEAAALKHRSITDSPVPEPILIFNDDEDHVEHSTTSLSRYSYGDESGPISVDDVNVDQGHANDSIFNSAHRVLSLLSFSKVPPCDTDNNNVLQPPWIQSDEVPSDHGALVYKIQRRQSRRKRLRSADSSLEQFPDDDSDCSSTEELAWMEFQQPTQDDSMKSMEDVMVEWNSNSYQHCGQQFLPVPLSIKEPLSPSRPPSVWVPKRVPLQTTSTKVEL